MTLKSLEGLRPGASLGHVAEIGPGGTIIANTVEIAEAEIPEASVLASGSTHAYIASQNRNPHKGHDRIVIAVEDGGGGEALVGVAALDTSGDIKIDPEMVRGPLSVVLRRGGFIGARLVGLSHIECPDKLAEQAGFEPDGSGELIFEPDSTHRIQPTPGSANW